MSSVTSATTFAELAAIYRGAASYIEDNDVAKCRTFITACNALLLDLPKRTVAGRVGDEIEFSVEQITAALKMATAWLSANDSNETRQRVRHVSLENFRY